MSSYHMGVGGSKIRYDKGFGLVRDAITMGGLFLMTFQAKLGIEVEQLGSLFPHEATFRLGPGNLQDAGATIRNDVAFVAANRSGVRKEVPMAQI